MNRFRICLLALYTAAWATSGCSDPPSLSSDGEPMVVLRSDAISDCGSHDLANHSRSAYRMLHAWKWQSGGLQDRRASTHPSWYGCTGDVRERDDSLDGTYVYEAPLGVVFRADWPQPPNTVALRSWVFEPGPCNAAPDYLTTASGGVPARECAMATESATFIRVEGYVFPWNLRLPEGSGTLTLTSYTWDAGADGLEAEQSVFTSLPGMSDYTAGAAQGHIFDPSMEIVPPGSCTTDADCPTNQRCEIRVGACVGYLPVTGIATTGGGGMAEGANYRLRLSVGTPTPVGAGSSSQHVLEIDPGRVVPQ